MRQGTIDNPPKPPVIPGFECSGIVESVGENTAGLEVNEMQSLSGAQNVFQEKQKLMQGAARLLDTHSSPCFTLASLLPTSFLHSLLPPDR